MDTGQASKNPGATAAAAAPDSSKIVQAASGAAQRAQGGGGEQKGGDDGAAPSKRRNRRGRGPKKGDESSQKAVNEEGGGTPTAKSVANSTAAPQKAQGKSSSQAKQVKLLPKEARSPKVSQTAKAPAAAVMGSQAQTATAIATTDGASATKKKAKKRRDRKRKEKKAEGHGVDLDDDDDIDAQQQRPRLKVVVRRLPPNLPESVFWRSVEPWIKVAGQTQQQAENAKESGGGDPSKTSAAADEEKADWTYFVPGKLKDGARRGAPPDARELLSHTHARAYIRFTSLDPLLAFHRAFDGHVFRDEARKMDYAAIVEFAAFQKIPTDLARARGAAAAKNKNKFKADDKENTIENDAEFKEFVANLQEREKAPAEKTDAQLMADIASNQAEKAKSTPLLEHLRKQKAGKKQRSGGGGSKGSGAAGSTAKEKKTKKQLTNAAAVAASTSSLGPAAITKGGTAPTPPTKPAAMKDKGKDKGKAGAAAAPPQGKKKRSGNSGKGGKEREKEKQGSGAGPQVAILKRPEPK